MPAYARAKQLIEADRVRATGCAAFAYNLAAPDYNASTLWLEDRYVIASEGPREKDVEPFFTLLKEQDVTHLVRLTDAFEREIPKCHPYWEGVTEKRGDGSAYLLVPGGSSIRCFSMPEWADNQGVDPKQLLKMALQVKEEMKRQKGKLLVHCSAGVGRTGTFFAALLIIRAIENREPFSIEEIVYRLSLQRPIAVGHSSQYVTLHALAEEYLAAKLNS